MLGRAGQAAALKASQTAPAGTVAFRRSAVKVRFSRGSAAAVAAIVILFCRAEIGRIGRSAGRQVRRSQPHDWQLRERRRFWTVRLQDRQALPERCGNRPRQNQDAPDWAMARNWPDHRQCGATESFARQAPGPGSGSPGHGETIIPLLFPRPISFPPPVFHLRGTGQSSSYIRFAILLSHRVIRGIAALILGSPVVLPFSMATLPSDGNKAQTL